MSGMLREYKDACWRHEQLRETVWLGGAIHGDNLSPLCQWVLMLRKVHCSKIRIPALNTFPKKDRLHTNCRSHPLNMVLRSPFIPKRTAQ
eukprot:1143842-Pelagomonas_calceolata.AAC.2